MILHYRTCHELAIGISFIFHHPLGSLTFYFLAVYFLRWAVLSVNFQQELGKRIFFSLFFPAVYFTFCELFNIVTVMHTKYVSRLQWCRTGFRACVPVGKWFTGLNRSIRLSFSKLVWSEVLREVTRGNEAVAVQEGAYLMNKHTKLSWGWCTNGGSGSGIESSYVTHWRPVPSRCVLHGDIAVYCFWIYDLRVVC